MEMKMNDSLNRLLVTMTAALLLFALTAAKGGTPVTITRTPGNFSSLDLSGVYKVTLVEGSSCSVALKGDAEDIEAVVTRVGGSELQVFVKSNRKMNSKVELTITYVNLKSVECSGAVELTAAQPVRTDKLAIDLSGTSKVDLELMATTLDIDMSGAGDVILKGNVKNTNIDVSGAGKLSAGAMQTENCWVDISGTGNVDIKVSNLLEAEIAGAGNISYAGDPVLHKSVSGSGKVMKI